MHTGFTRGISIPVCIASGTLFLFNIWYIYQCLLLHFAEKKEYNVNMTRRWPCDCIHEGGHIRAYAPRLWRQNSMSLWLLSHLPVCPDVVHLYICMSMCPSTHSKHNRAKIGENGRKTLGNALPSYSMMRAASDDIRDPSLLDSINQSVSVFVSHDRRGQGGGGGSNSQWGAGSWSNVLLPTMYNKEKFIQLSNSNLPRPCITPAGIISNNEMAVIQCFLKQHSTMWCTNT